MTGDQRQAIFDAINQAIETHAPLLLPDIRITIATDAALKIAGITATPADADADAVHRFDRRIKR